MEHKLRVIRLRFIIVKSFEKIKILAYFPKLSALDSHQEAPG